MSSSCSTTITVLPRSRRRLSTEMSLAVSRGCRPMLGSSSMYIEPTRLEPSEVTRLMRWLSPPERVLQARLSVRYDRPTSLMHCRRESISESGSATIARSVSVICIDPKKSSASSMFIWSSSSMVRPRRRTQSASLRRRLPPHSGQVARPQKRDIIYLNWILYFWLSTHSKNSSRPTKLFSRSSLERCFHIVRRCSSLSLQ